jgi:hypothetical protein
MTAKGELLLLGKKRAIGTALASPAKKRRSERCLREQRRCEMRKREGKYLMRRAARETREGGS